MPDHVFALPSTRDGQTPFVHVWRSERPESGIVVLAHGMGEHSLRYEPLAKKLVAAGFAVYAMDHRGHGRTVRDAAQLGDYGPEGWRGLIDDQVRLLRKLRGEYRLPILVMGHSMGSMVVQHLMTEASELIDGAALSGTTAVDVMAAAITASTKRDDVATDKPDLFASFNAAFEPTRTESDWLSRDPEQVDLYVADPLCGFAVSDASFTSLMEAGIAFSTDAATQHIRKDLPIFLFAGDADPVGLGGVLVERVAERYRMAGIEDVTLKLYPGARHEVFNETNREEVEADFIAWATRVRKLTRDGEASR